jgi:hypothetical protein
MKMSKYRKKLSSLKWSIQMTTGGAVTITAATSIELNAPTITLNGTVVEMKAVSSAILNGGASCTVQGAVVKIN